MEDVRVLVVDDCEDSAEALVTLLRGWGYDARAAISGQQALAHMDDFQPLGVLLDINMPGMNGLELSRGLRQRFGEDLVLIAVTGLVSDADRERAEAAGVDFVLVKPLDLSRLRKLLPPIT